MEGRAFDSKTDVRAQLEATKFDVFKPFVFSGIGVRVSVQCGPTVRSTFLLEEGKDDKERPRSTGKERPKSTSYPLWHGIDNPLRMDVRTRAGRPEFAPQLAVAFEVAIMQPAWMPIADLLENHPVAADDLAWPADSREIAIKCWGDDYIGSFVPLEQVHHLLQHLAKADAAAKPN